MKDWMIRAIKTFVQAAGSFIVADITILSDAMTDMSAFKQTIVTVLVGAVAAGISAVWNIILEQTQSKE